MGEAQVTNPFQIESRRLIVKALSAERKIPNKKETSEHLRLFAEFDKENNHHLVVISLPVIFISLPVIFISLPWA
jgi:hypothetical protein